MIWMPCSTPRLNSKILNFSNNHFGHLTSWKIVNKQLENVNKFSKIEKIHCHSNSFWLYRHRGNGALLQFYNHLLSTIFIRNALYNDILWTSEDYQLIKCKFYMMSFPHTQFFHHPKLQSRERCSFLDLLHLFPSVDAASSYNFEQLPLKIVFLAFSSLLQTN